jgi:hypothetical protein
MKTITMAVLAASQSNACYKHYCVCNVKLHSIIRVSGTNSKESSVNSTSKRRLVTTQKGSINTKAHHLT